MRWLDCATQLEIVILATCSAIRYVASQKRSFRTTGSCFEGVPLDITLAGMEEPGHVSGEQLENYVRLSLSDGCAGTIEEHLLICSQCREKVRQLDDYDAVVRNALGSISPDVRSLKGPRTKD